ncbi:hypothetical protein IC575_014755 [Cucumis melo]
MISFCLKNFDSTKDATISELHKFVPQTPQEPPNPLVNHSSHENLPRILPFFIQERVLTK